MTCSNLLQLWHNLEVMYRCTLLFFTRASLRVLLSRLWGIVRPKTTSLFPAIPWRGSQRGENVLLDFLRKDLPGLLLEQARGVVCARSTLCQTASALTDEVIQIQALNFGLHTRHVSLK